MTKNKILIGLVIFLALTAGFMAYMIKNYNQVATNINPYEIALPDLNDQLQSLAQWQGKTLVLNFWATWCPPCLAEIPAFITLQDQLKSQGVQFVGIAIDEPNAVKNYLQTLSINYPILLAEKEGLHLSLKLGNVLGAVPYTIIFNATGQVIHRQMGELSAEKLKEILQSVQVSQL